MPPSDGFIVARVEPARRVEAAERLVAVPREDRRLAASRLVASAAGHGIDLDLFWCTLDSRPGGAVRESCLAVLGAGRTAMLFLPGAGPTAAGRSDELADLVSAAYQGVTRERPQVVRIVQALPEPREVEVCTGLTKAGFVRVGELAYLRRSNRGRSLPVPVDRWPPGVEVRSYASTGDAPGDEARLIEALDRSYEQTLDCPELCGLRETRDVLASHRATGEWSPDLWWLVIKEARPVGCVLFNRCRASSTVELVYLGLGRELRGLGLGSSLLAHALSKVREEDASEVSCAVDTRNEPAMRLYRRAGFRVTGKRVAMVRPAP